MKCAKCGAELKVGCIYCSSCGQEAQIVSDDSLLEEELLRQLLLEEEAEKKELSGKGRGQKASKDRKEKPGEPKPKKKSHIVPVIVLVLLAALIALAVTIYFVLKQRNDNSFDYQLQKASDCVAERNYTRALEYYQRALELDSGNLTVLTEMASLYERMEEPGKATSIYHELIGLDKSNVTAYQKLIGYYQDQEDFEAILKLKETAGSAAVQSLFSDFEVEAPEFGLQPGTYSDTIEVELLTQGQCEIYYSQNGADPVTKGSLYTAPIRLEEQGELHIRAVARNQYGLYSEIVEGKYEVKYEKPRMPRAYPDSGSFNTPSTIELSGVEGARIYYTWDGTDPTSNSAEYTGPIEVPEGNNILSVIQIDSHGMISDVLKCNYKYLP